MVPADWLRDKSKVIGGWLPSLTLIVSWQHIMQTRIINLCMVTAFALLTVTVVEGVDLSWPDRGTNGLAWPKPKSAGKIIEDRFLSAATNALGSAADMEAIKSAIGAARPHGKVKKIRWLSPRLVMAKVRFPESSYYYVVQKRKEEWGILTWYLEWIR
jgi:hypothetical protein